MPTRIVHLITSLNRGGAEGMLVRLLADSGRATDIDHSVIALMSDGSLTGQLLEAGVPVEELGQRRGRVSPTAFVRLVRSLRASRPDLIMTWLYHNDLLGSLARPVAGSPRIVWNLRRSADIAAITSRRTRTVLRILSRLSPYPDAIAANSISAIEAHRNLGYRPKAWLHLPNGFQTDVWRPDTDDRLEVRHTLGFEHQHRVIAHVGRADPEKDHANLLRAAESFLSAAPSARLVLIGRGTEGLVRPRAVADRILALGERNDVERLLRGADIGVLSSVTEGLPNAIGEAMSTGLPVVATDVGDAARLVGATGRIVRPRDSAALAQNLLEMVHLPDSQLRKLGAEARRRVIDHYSFETARTAYERVWRGEMRQADG